MIWRGEVRWMRMWWWTIVLIGTTIICLLNGAFSLSLARQAKQSRHAGHEEKENSKTLTAKRKAESRAKVHKLSSIERPGRHRTLTRLSRHDSVRTHRRIASIRRVKPVGPAPVKKVESVLLADAETGQILVSEDIDKQWPAASLTKMMVGLLAMEDIERENLSLRTPVTVSGRASRAKGRTIDLHPGEVFPLGELLQAMLVTSANDAAVAVAERIRGSVDACVEAMNRRARALGMTQTEYQTVNGLPLSDGSTGDFSSARDLALLGRALLKYHRVLEWTSLDQVPFRDGLVMLPNTNHLVGKVEGVNGLKTGFTSRARYNLVATARRGSLSLIAVVLGGRSSRVRFETAEHFLEWGFTNYARQEHIGRGEQVHGDLVEFPQSTPTDMTAVLRFPQGHLSPVLR